MGIIQATEVAELKKQLAEVSFRNERLVADYAELEQQLATLRELKQAWHDKFWEQNKETNQLRKQLAEQVKGKEKGE